MKISKATVRQLCNDDQLPGAEKKRGRWMIPIEAIEKQQSEQPLVVEGSSTTPATEPGPPVWWNRFRNHPFIFYLTLVFVIIAAVVGLLAGVAGFGADYESARQQWKAWGLSQDFPAATDDETLILIATFHETRADRSEPHTKIRRAIREAAAATDLDNLRVEEEPTILKADEREAAEALGNRYNAAMIIWGEDTGVQVIVNFLNLKQPDYTAAEVQIEESERVQLANPNAYTQFIVEDLPHQLTFLALFAVGITYINIESYEAALTTIEAAIAALSPETQPAGLAEAYFRVGWLYSDPLVDLEKAIENYDQAIALDPQYTIAFYNRANTYYDKGELERAVADFTEALRINPEYAAALINRGIAYHDKGELERAIKDYNEAIRLNPEDAAAFINRGVVYGSAGELERAIADFTEVLRLNPEDVVALTNRGVAYRTIGELERAIADYTAALRINPNFANAFYNRGVAYWEKGELERAIKDYNEAIRLNPEDAAAFINRGVAYYDKGELEWAVADLEKYLDLAPNADDREEVLQIIEQLKTRQGAN